MMMIWAVVAKHRLQKRNLVFREPSCTDWPPELISLARPRGEEEESAMKVMQAAAHNTWTVINPILCVPLEQSGNRT